MERYKPITPETRKSNRWTAACLFFFGLVFGWALTVSIIFEIDQHFVLLLLYTVGSCGCFVLSVWVWRQKKELNDEALTLLEEEKKLPDPWYIRYLLATFGVGWAYVCYYAWFNVDYSDASALVIVLINPITGVLWALGALVLAKELSLILIVIGAVYLLILGVSSLPTSFALVLGACIIAYAIFKAQS